MDTALRNMLEPEIAQKLALNFGGSKKEIVVNCISETGSKTHLTLEILNVKKNVELMSHSQGNNQLLNT